jgi:predicted RNA polymerase sigma factor
MISADIDRAIRAAWRIEQPRLITTLSRMLRDVPLAEELTQDALLAALESWPASGVPDKPGAWLMATAKRSIICAAARCLPAPTTCWRATWRGSSRRCRIGTQPSMTISAMNGCG